MTSKPLVTCHLSLSLERSAYGFVQALAITARQGQLHAFAQEDAILAVKPRLQFLYAINIDDSRAMHAHELARVELRFERRDGVAQQVRFFAGVQAHVIAFGFEPINLLGLHEED